MSFAGHAASSSGCVARPRERETGLTGFAVPIQLSLPTGSYVMEPAEHREPYEPSHVRFWERLGVKFPRATHLRTQGDLLSTSAPKGQADGMDEKRTLPH